MLLHWLTAQRLQREALEAQREQERQLLEARLQEELRRAEETRLQYERRRYILLASLISFIEIHGLICMFFFFFVFPFFLKSPPLLDAHYVPRQSRRNGAA